MTHLLSEGKKNSHRGWATSLHRRQNSWIVNVQDVPLPEHIENGKKFQISGIWYYFTHAPCLFLFILLLHLVLAAVRCLPWVLSLSPDIGTVFNGWYFLSSSCPLPSHPASVMVTLRELW